MRLYSCVIKAIMLLGMIASSILVPASRVHADDALPPEILALLPPDEEVQASIAADLIGSGQLVWAVASLEPAMDNNPRRTGHVSIVVPGSDGWTLATLRDLSSLTPVSLDTVPVAGRQL